MKVIDQYDAGEEEYCDGELVTSRAADGEEIETCEPTATQPGERKMRRVLESCPSTTYCLKKIMPTST